VSRSASVSGLCLLLAAGITVCGPAGAAAPTAIPPPPPPVAGDIAALDRQTGKLLTRLAQGRVAQALALSRVMVARYPTYRLGQLLHAELLSVEALDGVRPLSRDAWPEEMVDLLLEARTRLALARASEGPRAMLPRALVHLGDDIDDVIMVDLSHSELRHYRAGPDGVRLAGRHYVSSGSAGFGKWREGDRRTPLGVYRILALRPDRALPELYGAAALTLDYPNALDRELGRTGSGIWLHGVPRTHPSRPPWSSEGCVTMSNQHLLRLIDGLDLERSVVVLADRIEEVPDEVRQARAALHHATPGIAPGSTLIEVPSRGPATHMAVLVSDPHGAGRSSRAGPRWQFVPVSAASLASSEPASP